MLGEPDEIQDMGASQIPEDVFQQYLIGLSEKDFRWEFPKLIYEQTCA